MDAIDGQEVMFPVVMPKELWAESGRYYSIGDEMVRFKDRTNRDMVLGMTHEEAAVHFARDAVNSYQQLPCMIYQIQTKWRDDPRPRAGLIRVREFTMKDAYSFHATQESLDEAYADQYKAYFRIYSRCGLPCVAVGADSGMMGGKISHEYMYLSPIGEDTIITCPECGYTANRHIASFKKEYFKAEPLPMEKVATPDASTIEDLASLLKIEPRQTCKMVFMVGSFISDKTGEEEDKLVVAAIRGDLDVEESKLSNAIKANALRPAHPEEIEEYGMVPGFASPIGAKKGFVLCVDDSVAESNNLVAGANEVGYHFINSNYKRDWDGGIVADIASAKEGYTCPVCGKSLKSSKGVEIGNIFQLGTRYSKAMNCTFQDENGVQQPVIMGCYGIGVGRLLACLSEEYNDDKGLCLPITVAPYQVHLVSLLKDNAVGEKIYQELVEAGIEVLYDDRKETAGVKFADADLIGIPIRITLGNRSYKEGKVEVKYRRSGEETSYRIEGLVDEIKKEMGNEEHLEIGAYNINWTITISTTLDSTRLKKEDSELWNRYSKEGITRRFSITAPKR